jgi:hypothetical protein
LRQLELYSGEQQIFDLFFASVTSLAHCHPGNCRNGASPISIEECADIALGMIDVRRDVITNSFLAAKEREEAQAEASRRDYLAKQRGVSYEDPFYDPIL